MDRLRSPLFASVFLLLASFSLPSEAANTDFAHLSATHAQLAALPFQAELASQLNDYVNRQKLEEALLVQGALPQPKPRPVDRLAMAQPQAEAPDEPETEASSAALAAISAVTGEETGEKAAEPAAEVAMAYAPAGKAATGEDKQGTVSEKELNCLAEAIYFEARGEPETGQVAVAQVVLNRTKSGKYPKTICGVVYQNKQRRNACQFSFACDGHADVKNERKAWQRAQRIAADVTTGRQRIAAISTATHYHADYVSPYWAPKMERLSQIGEHIFYKE